MSNLIPPLLSSSPPPIVGPLDEDDDDEFGDFRAAADSYDCDDFSLPPSPEKELKTDASKVNLDINCNKSQKATDVTEMPTQKLNGSIVEEEVNKDFQDRRKSLEECESEVNSSNSQSVSPPTCDAPESVNVLERAVDEVVGEPCADQDEDEFADLQSGVQSSQNCGQAEANGADSGGPSDLNSFSNEENVFDAFSESVQENASNSDDLSELNESNEIISENVGIEEINCEITEDKDNSSKDNLSESSLSLRDYETDPKPTDDDFGDFENHFSAEFDVEGPPDDDEFDDFANPEPEQADDDFGDFESSDFGDFSAQTSEKPTFLEIDEKNAVDKSETILKGVFPPLDSEIREFECADETRENAIFNELKDVTETNALIYQWSKSNSQKMFFKALNIDTRNILYGPAWSCSMPRFAANLGLAPLEPVKTEILTPTPAQNLPSPSNSSQKSNGDIPTAQFDWSGSGLINPLDYLEQLVASLDIPSTTHPNSDQSPTPSNELMDEWDLWLQSAAPAERVENVPEDSSQPHPLTDAMPGLFDGETLEKMAAEKESIEPTRSSENFSPKLIPLRETHIATDLNDLSNPGWLQPTIVTPDMPRKETVVDADDDEFDDFQMVLPEENKAQTAVAETKNDLSFEFDMTSRVPSHNHEHILGISLNSGPISSLDRKEDDDEFTEFHSSAPQADILKPVQAVPLEPLRPVVQYSTPVAQINWPDPGVTDDDVKNIELTYSRRKETTVKESSVDEDEWSDFVSVTNLAKSAMPERTATPDLPLSVLNLNHVQAPKQPIPVITPSGLVQTKLSSGVPKSVVQTKVQPNLFRPPATLYQPSIISSQYAANFPSAAKSQDDEDDWSDFVSSRPPAQVNGYQQKSGQRAPPINWTSATTNIIMNPSHFETFPKYAQPQNKKVAALPSRSSAIPSISAIPDLDFIAPKNRTSKK